MFHLVVSAIVKQNVFEQTSWSCDCSCVSSATCLSDRRRLLRRAAMGPDLNASATATMDPDPNDEDSALLKKYPKCAWCITCRSVKLHLSHFSTAKKHGKRKEPVTASELKEYLAKKQDRLVEAKSVEAKKAFATLLFLRSKKSQPPVVVPPHKLWHHIALNLRSTKSNQSSHWIKFCKTTQDMCNGPSKAKFTIRGRTSHKPYLIEG